MLGIVMMLFTVRSRLGEIVAGRQRLGETAAGTPTEQTDGYRHAGQGQRRQIDADSRSTPKLGHREQL